ncbi:MAG: FAD:protein FMN transferase [Anaerovoracaceae bacterium]
MRKKILTLILCTVVIITQVSCSSNEPVSKTGFYLNTNCQIDILDKSKSQGEEIIDGAFKLIGELENQLSRTVESSDIYKINHAKGKPVEVKDETVKLIKQGVKISEETNGEFDITVGKLTELWGFSDPEPKKPADKDIKKAAATVGYKNIKIQGNKVSLTNPDTWLDLGATAKGYIADRASEYVESKGVKSAVINLGGNIVTIGRKTDGDKPWKIGIEAPYSDRKEIVGAVQMEDQTVVTSGTYERFFEENGKKYHHILDTKTGYPVDSDITAISILSKKGNSGMSDVLSTTSLLLGKERAIKFIEKQEGFEYMIIDSQGKTTQSAGFNMEKK